jgi:ribosomal protein S18 acetylase RimI-like enzyme
MIIYTGSLDGIGSEKLAGFFVGWPTPPSPDTHLEMLRRSAAVLLAVDDATGRVVGFINAISDGVLSAFIPLLEVLPDYQGRGIGSELARRMLERLGDLYMVDLLCDPDLVPFYTRLGMTALHGMGKRNRNAKF